ncbi:hypothetical protein COLO4_38182 [Corchorus olitorius]|uniref:Peroxidase n=1 Tax=Corchorus olitorius TaxID=93759 RepID=A0A1R3FWI6_9ROSI|nr:hypothetical protein COLO4_38182 [Corchorus olitorius]
MGEKTAPPNNNSARGFVVVNGIEGSQTIGVASCRTFRGHIYNDSNIDHSFANSLQTNPINGDDSVATPLDLQTQSSFGNSYYKNLLSNKGLFHSDQELSNERVADEFVKGIDGSISLDNNATLIGEKIAPPNNNSAKGFEVIDGIKGSHTIGVASCRTFRGRIYIDSNINPSFANSLQNSCPFSGNDSVATPLDLQTQSSFGNSYYKNLLSNKGLFHSDLELSNARVADDFFKGCDGSILLDDNATFIGDKIAPPNNNSVKGFEVIDGIKGELENACPGLEWYLVLIFLPLQLMNRLSL